MTMSEAMILSSSLVLATSTYLVWPSRWNIMAHLAVAFWVVSVFIPVAIADVAESYPLAIVERLAWVMMVGALAYAFGVILGGFLGPPRALGVFGRLSKWDANDRDYVARRTIGVGIGAIVMLATALTFMGFVPMFAADPFAAKFFRGEYGEAYRPVAPFYRAASGILTVLLPLLLVYGFSQARRLRWQVAFGAGFVLMLGTLQREPAVTGLLLVIGLWLASRRHSAVFFWIAVAAYTAGALFYSVLSRLGVLKISAEGTRTFPETVAASAPDVTDALAFLARWESMGQPLTYGRTFFGGIIPGNYEWNPSVWSLTLGNANIDVESIASGGLRLPLPVWGLVAFGTLGVLAVSLGSGLLAGLLARCMALTMPSLDSVISRLWATVLYSVYVALFVDFVTIGYLTVLQFGVIYWVCQGFRERPETLRARSSPLTRF